MYGGLFAKQHNAAPDDDDDDGTSFDDKRVNDEGGELVGESNDENPEC